MNGLFSLDALLHKALRLHQDGNLAAAETVYQQVLGLQPNNPEILVNCALAQLGQNKIAAAKTSLQEAIRIKPDLAKAHHRLGDVLCRDMQFQEAANSYRRAIKLNPNYVEAYINLGNALLSVGDLTNAARAYLKVTQLQPSSAAAHNNLGLTYLDMAEPEKAKAAFEEALRHAPDFADAHNNLGYALHLLEQPEPARASFKKAIAINAHHADAHANLAVSFMSEGKSAEAERAANFALKLNPQDYRAYDTLGKALWAQGDLEQAEKCYREAIRLNPNYPDVHNHIGMVLEERGRLDEAFIHFNRHAQLTYGSPAFQPRTNAPPHKLHHDDEQRAWLKKQPAGFSAEAPRLPGPAVNRPDSIQNITEQWHNSKPQILVVDNLLTAPALESLRNFCLASKVWHKSFEEGYLGALPEYGFAAPLIAQIAEELRSAYPTVIEDHPLLHFWGFKYDSSLRGIKVHADFAAVNVNFWITPDDANLDSTRGGLVVWDAAAPLDWDFAKYNAANSEIRAFLARENAKAITVPYRANRAVIFDSDLFHETDVIHFKPEYENRRINVTLLFGRRKNSRDTGTVYPTTAKSS